MICVSDGAAGVKLLTFCTGDLVNKPLRKYKPFSVVGQSGLLQPLILFRGLSA